MDADAIFHELPHQGTIDSIEKLGHHISSEQIVMKLRVQNNGGKT